MADRCPSCHLLDGHFSGCGSGTTPPVFLRIAIADAETLAALDKIAAAWRARGQDGTVERLREIAASAIVKAVAHGK